MEAVTQYDERLLRTNNSWPIRIRIARPRSQRRALISRQGGSVINNLGNNHLLENNQKIEQYICSADTSVTSPNTR
jgi:hypothetical protein